MTEPVYPGWANTLYAQQDASELSTVANLIRGKSSYLEIGCSFGQTWVYLGMHLAPGAKIRGIDLGVMNDNAPGEQMGYDLKPHLLAAEKHLCDLGYDAKMFFGNSQDQQTIEWAKQNAPYDFILIDAAHDYEGVAADWRAYRWMGANVGFHDIKNPGLGVSKLWREISTVTPNNRLIEAFNPKGIGIVTGLHT